MKTPSMIEKELFKKLSPILGIDSKVTEYGDDECSQTVYIMTTPDPIDKNVVFYNTIGLFNYPINNDKHEILITGYNKYELVPSILSTIAFFIIKDKWNCQIGNVFETVVEMYYPNSLMKHILFVSPYLWEDKLEDFKLEGEPINFVLAIPISQSELEYKSKNGLDGLESLFEEKEIDIFNLTRLPVI